MTTTDDNKKQQETPTATPPNNDEGSLTKTTKTPESESSKKTNKKKKPPLVVPVEVSTGAFLVRAAALSVLGCCCSSTEEDVTGPSVLQPTFLKDFPPHLTAKFSLPLGSKKGNTLLPLDEVDCDELYQAMEAAANRLLQSCNNNNSNNNNIDMWEATKAELVATYGSGVLFDAASAKRNDQDRLLLASLEHEVAVVSQPLLQQPSHVLDRIVLDPSQSNVTAGKKVRNASVTLKFQVVLKNKNSDKNNNDDDDGDVVVLATPNNSNLQPLPAPIRERRIRAPEGQALYDKIVLAQQQQQQEEEEQQDKQQEQQDVIASSSPPQQESEQQQQPSEQEDEEAVVTIETVSGKIDYDKLVHQFGSTLITETTLEKLARIAAATAAKSTAATAQPQPLHRFLRRNIFFSHRDLDVLLDSYEKGDAPVYLYTGRGPSSAAMHLGHLIPFLFTKYLQEALDVPLVIQMTDDEKFLFKGTYDAETGDDNLDDFYQLTMENARDILACGFHKDKTFLFSDLDYAGRMYPNIVRIWKAATANSVNNIFGFDGSSNIGKLAFPAVQAAPSFASSFPTVLQADRNSDMLCLIPCAIDQDPYFRLTRDVAHKLVCHNKKHKLGGKPALIHSKFFPPLQGATGKMSSSDQNSAIFLTDTADEIERKIKSFAFSGGRDTAKEQRELGADLEVDVAYQWLRFFLEDDDELARIGQDYGSGSGEYWSTSKVKNRLVQVVQELVAEHQARRATITDEEVREWMKERSIV